MKPRKIIKEILQKLGLLNIAKRAIAFSPIHELKQIYSVLPHYLYNNVINQFPVHFVRVFFLRHGLGVKVGKYSFIHMGARLRGEISIGDHSVIGRNCVLLGNVIIKNNVSITAETYIFTTSHILDSPNFECFYKKVTIEDYAWIGARAMILPGVTIGKGAVLGAASTATKDIPPFAIFAGAPAKQVGTRKDQMQYNLVYLPYLE